VRNKPAVLRLCEQPLCHLALMWGTSLPSGSYWGREEFTWAHYSQE
jgi:hypothetical protein